MINLKIVEKLQLGKLVTALPDRNRPVYNWFQMKESFSRELVRLLVETWKLQRRELVLDPFCGAGTTPLACKEFALDSVGFDVHPIMLLASRVKIRDYNIEELKKTVKELMLEKFEKTEIDVPGFVARVFQKSVLQELVSIRNKILELADEKIREFMLLGLTIASMRCSWAYKDGAAIKVVKRRILPLQKTLEQQLLKMCHDLEQFPTKHSNVTIDFCDARKLKLEDETINAVITSPPYFRKHEYVYAYRIEQWITGLEGPDPQTLVGIRGENVDKEDFSTISEFEKAPLEAKFYLKDMFSVIKELHRVCKEGAMVCMVASDGCYPRGVIDICVPLSRLAEKAGFKTRRMIVVNRRYCTTPRRKKVGVTREALLIWQK